MKKVDEKNKDVEQVTQTETIEKMAYTAGHLVTGKSFQAKIMYSDDGSHVWEIVVKILPSGQPIPIHEVKYNVNQNNEEQ